MSAKKIDSEKTEKIMKDLKGLWDSGVAAAKKGIKKSGNAISEFGDYSVMKIDSAKYAVQIEKKYYELGKICAGLFFDSEKASVTRKSEGVSEKLEEIKDLMEKISAIEKELDKFSKSKETGGKDSKKSPAKAKGPSKEKETGDAKKTVKEPKVSKTETESKKEAVREEKTASPKKKTAAKKTTAKKE